MAIRTEQAADGIAEVVMDHPPVNALDVAAWFELADALLAAGRVPTNRVVVLRAEGRGFCAGVDIKEIQAKGDEALVGVNRGCAAAFAAVYDCEVPVHRRGQRLLPRRRHRARRQRRHHRGRRRRDLRAPRGRPRALGAATHLARLVPQHVLRQLVYTARSIPAAEARHLRLARRRGPPAELRATALGIASVIAGKSPSSCGGPRNRSTASTRST